MMRFFPTLLTLALAASPAFSQAVRPPGDGGPKDSAAEGSAQLAKATFGGGCFWCTEAIFEQLEGVDSVVSGFSGGSIEFPTYKQVLTGRTGHAEVVQITYDPQVVSYKDLLEVFWKTHNPTTLNRQGPDKGTQYRSVIFYHTEEQRQLANFYKKRLDDAKLFSAPVVTEIVAFEAFYPAEQYHQDYAALNPQARYCQQYIRPKLEKLQKVFAEKLKKEPESVGTVRKTNQEWRSLLTRDQYLVTRRKETEPAFSGEFWNHKEDGVYKCVCCELPLFDSATKFESNTGWPSYWMPVAPQHIAQEIDRSGFQIRMEVKCARCDAHLGHVFNDGPRPTGLRYCINSVALQFEQRDE